ncbi:MAG: nucleoside hydrolase [Erysipelotrichaceae bacterium]|nr:nucleoside hydrolase [Erysipelotrichaceae bacterium]
MNQIKKKAIILDGDPGHDDAIAFVLAAAFKDYLDIKAITACGGNQTLAKTTLNYRKIATLLGLTNIPIAAGREKPLQADLVIAPNYHGESGLDGPKLPDPEVELSELSAVELMANVLRESDEKVTIVATGPQTNVASLLLAHPELKDKIEAISIMGGGLEHGNWTSTAEFNIIVDPESADIEFRSGVPVIMAGLDVTEKAYILPSEWDVLRGDNEVADIVAQWCDFFYIHLKELGWPGALMHDPCSIMVLVHPEIFVSKDLYVQIDTKGEFTRGATVPDYHGLLGQKPNCKCLLDVDRELFVKYLIEACQSFRKDA